MRRACVVLLTCGFCLFLAVTSLSTAGAATPALRPNIVLILVDDMGWSDIGCYGGEIKTPHLDQLAREGMRFTQFYNNAKCTTTRASLMTGLYPRRQGDLLKTNMVTLGEVLGAAGYQTAVSGKWHLGAEPTTHPYHRGFQEFYGLLDGACNHFDPALPDPPYKGGAVRRFAHNDQPISSFPENFYSSDAFTDHALQTVRRFATNSAPFFLHLSFTAPHYPLHAKPADVAKYRGAFQYGWEAMRLSRYERQVSMGLLDPATCKLSQGDSRAYPWAEAAVEFEDLRMAVYAAMVDCVDQNIGRLLQALRETGTADNTVIFFLSDNGGCPEEPGGRDPSMRTPGPKEDYVAVGPAWGWAQNTPFRRYKLWTHEGGICTPMIAWYPKMIRPASITRSSAHIIDFMPTLLELAGATYPQQFRGQEIIPVEGRSMLALLKGEDKAQHEFLAWEWAGSRAYRQGDWKLVWDKEVKEWELYDLATDRTEMIDRAKEKPELVGQLRDAWFAWARQTGAPGKL